MKAGQICCGACERVLRDDKAEREMRPHEKAAERSVLDHWAGEWWKLSALELGRTRHLAETGKYVTYRGIVHWEIACKCAIFYRVPGRELRDRADAARAAGASVYLGRADRGSAR